MASLVSSALKTAAIGGLIGFAAGMVSGIAKKASSGDDFKQVAATTTDPEIEQMGHQLHDYGDSRAVMKLLYQLLELESSEAKSMSLPKEAYAVKHNLDVELGLILDSTSADRQEKLKELINEIMEFANGNLKNIVFDSQEQLTESDDVK
jgi:hypothetical protein